MAEPTIVDLGAFAQGEVPPDLLVTFQDNDGNSINISGFTTEIRIAEELKGVTGFGTGVVTVLDAVNGQISYAWVQPDMLTQGQFTVQAWVLEGTDPDSKRYASDLYTYTVYDGPGDPPA
jgi:hypothetical protein